MILPSLPAVALAEVLVSRVQVGKNLSVGICSDV